MEADPSGVNLQSKSGATPLMLVCMAPNQAVLNDGGIMTSMLAVKDLDLGIKDDKGKTALDWARDKELFMIEKLITKRLEHSDPADDLSLIVSDLERKLKVAEDDNKSLKRNIEQMSKRMKEQEEQFLLHNLPEVPFGKIMMMVGLESLETLHNCRQVCTIWNKMIVSNEILQSIFYIIHFSATLRTHKSSKRNWLKL